MPELDASQLDSQEPDWVKALQGVPIGYTPLPTNVIGEPQGSIWEANFLNNTTIGSFIASPQSLALSGEVDRELDFIDHIPEDLVLTHADKYAGHKVEDFPIITQHIRDEMERDALIRAHPWQSFAVGIALSPLDPVSWLPMGALYRNVKHSTSLARSIIGSGAAGVIGTTAQEMVINRNQLTRTAEESFANIAAGGILASALGGLGYGITRGFTPRAKALFESRQRAHREIVDTLTGKEKSFDEYGLLKGEDLLNIPEPIRKLMMPTPMNRLLKSPFDTGKWFANSTYQKNYRLQKHLDLETDGADVETLIRLDKSKSSILAIKHQNEYFNMIGIDRGIFRGTRAKLRGVETSLDDFNLAVWKRLSTQIDDPRPHVNRAAKLWEDNLIKPTRERAIELGLLSEQQWPRNSVGYILQAYKKDKIIEMGGRSARGEGTFPQFLFDKFKSIQEEIKVFKASPEYESITERIKKAEMTLKEHRETKKLTPKTAKDKIKKINESIKKVKAELNQLKIEFKTKAPKRGLDSDGNLFPIVDDPTLWAHVEQTVDHVIGDGDGVIINPILAKLKGHTPSPLKQRKMTISQEELAEWSVTDVPRLMDMYTRALSPLIRLTELAKKNGAKDIAEFQKMLGDRLTAEYNAKAEGLTGKAATDLRKQRDKAAADISATFELLEGVYGDGPNLLNNSAQKYYQNFLKWNYVRLLGYMTLSSFADIGAQVFVHGPFRFIYDGLVSSFTDARKVSNRDLAAIGYGIETELGMRIKSWSDTQGLSTDPGPFTKGLDVLTQNFGNLSMMNQWNSWQQRMAGHIGINRTLTAIHNHIEGKSVSKKELERIVRNGLAREHWQTIYNFTKNNIADNDVRFADWTNWDIRTSAQREALEQFQASITKEIDSIVIVPGLGDKPLFAQKPLGKLLFQFKTFQMAATNRLLYSGIQRRDDINMYLGVISMLSMGAMSYMATTLIKGKELDLSFEKLSIEAVDRSGLIGVFSDIGNVIAKGMGLGGVSRYQSRDALGAFAGPTYGAVGEIFNLLRATKEQLTGEKDLTTNDVERLKRLFPYQNLFYLDRITRELFKSTALAAGAEESPER